MNYARRRIKLLIAFWTTATLFQCLLGSAIADPPPGDAAAASAPQGIWITGTVLSRDGLLLFDCDKKVKGNKTGSLVLLGATTETASVFLPALMKAAEKQMQLRLFGLLLPAPAKLPGAHVKAVPTVQFRVWKLHLPSDPDVLPPGQAVQVQ